MWYLLKDSSGKKSISYTMVVVTFTVCTVWMSLSMFQKVFHLDIRAFDATAATIWFAPLAGLYFGRRWQQGQAGSSLTTVTTQVINDDKDDTEDKT